MKTEERKYPIGKFTMPTSVTAEARVQAIADIGSFPQKIEAFVQTLPASALENKYRPDGWTLQQLIHHCSDSHLNAFVRFKLALTEESPQITGYAERLWTLLADNTSELLPATLNLLKGVHAKWHALLLGMSESDFQRTYFHPEQNRAVPLAEALMLYQWHCAHHLAHMRLALDDPQ